MRIIKAAIFDFDGTLVPFKMDYIALRQGIIDRIIPLSGIKDGFDVNDPIRITLKKAREVLNENDMKSLEHEAEEITTFYEMEGAKDNEIITGVSGVLKTLKAMNLKLGIFTLNQRPVIETLLKKANLLETFDAIVTRESIRDFYQNIIKLKYLRTCLEKLGVKGEEAIVVGDSPYDIEAGKLMNAITVGVNTHRNGKELLKKGNYDHLVEKVTEIPSLIQKVLAK